MAVPLRTRFPQIVTRSPVLLSVLTLGALLLCSCAAPRDEGEVQRYELKGKVVSVDKAQRQVVIAHEDVAGLMDAMTMPFNLKEDKTGDDALEVVAAGDSIQAVLVVGKERSWLENPVITKGGADESASDTSAGGQPAPGTEVPDFSLVNQDGRRIRLRQYAGRALLVTFVYTRCPLPDYCTLMSTNFAQIDREMEKEPELARRAHLLSVTIDPAYDKPEVLKSYGAAHTERYTKERFEHWEFATGAPEEIKRMADFFGLTYITEKDQITHSLRTALIAPDGRVHKIYRGNEWKPTEVMRDLRALLDAGTDGKSSNKGNDSGR